MTDRRIIITVLIAALLIWMGLSVVSRFDAGESVTVNVNGVDVDRLPLRGSQVVTKTVRGAIGNSTFEISGGRVRMVSSDCPDKVCEKMGWIERPGQVIVCLPNRVILKVDPD